MSVKDNEDDAVDPPSRSLFAYILPRKKISNRLEFLSSLLINSNASLVAAFRKLKVTRIEQVELLEIWSAICDDRVWMTEEEFTQKFLQCPSISLLTPLKMQQRVFRELNSDRGANASNLSFANWAVGMVRFCHYSFATLVSFSFRLMSSSGGAIDKLDSLEASLLTGGEDGPRDTKHALMGAGGLSLKPAAPPAISFTELAVFFDEFLVPTWGAKACVKPSATASRLKSITRE
jgi:hypothetical protein